MIKSMLLSPQFWIISVPFITAVVLWLLNERSKRRVAVREKKQECYGAMLGSLSGLLEKSHDFSKASDFVANLNRLWLYAPDNVVRSANEYVHLMVSDSEEEEQENALRELVMAMRRDVQRRTVLCSHEYKQISPGPMGQHDAERDAEYRAR